MNSPTEKADTAAGNRPAGIQSDLDLLRQLPLLQGVDPECLRILAMLCKQLNFLEGDLLVNQGEANECAFIILSGKLEAFVKEDSDERRLSFFGPGEAVCFSNLLGRVVSVITLRAASNIEVLRLNRQEFVKSLEQFPDSFKKVISNLVGELVKWDQQTISGLNEKPRDDHFHSFGISLL